jgi:CRISPR-associated protein Cmr3
MTWTMYKIDALDTLFFRDGRPFVAGEGTDVASRFPSSPLTLQGLIRSKLLSLPSVGCTEGWRQYREGCNNEARCCPKQGNCKAEKVVGSATARGASNGSLRVHGPWILVNECPVLPIPMDLIAEAEALKEIAKIGKGELSTEILMPDENGAAYSNLPGALKPLKPPPSWGEKKFEGVPGFIVWDRYKEYLCGTAPKLTLKEDWWRPSDLWGEELRPGLEIEDERSRAEQGKLYFARHTRLREKVALAVEMEGLGSLEQNMKERWPSPFGGERRAVVVEPMQPARNPWAGSILEKIRGRPS